VLSLGWATPGEDHPDGNKRWEHKKQSGPELEYLAGQKTRREGVGAGGRQKSRDIHAVIEGLRITTYDYVYDGGQLGVSL